MTYSYRRVDDDVKVFPVSFYSATITVTPTATGSEVDWIGRFYRGDTGNEDRRQASTTAMQFKR